MSYSLIVIDMQHYFKASRGRNVLQACEQEVQRAINHNAGILFVEFHNCGRTKKQITSIAKEYNRKYTVLKYQNDGSFEITSAIKHCHFSMRHLRICGVNTNSCVEDTVGGLQQMIVDGTLIKINVIANACFSDVGRDSHQRGLDRMDLFKEVSIINV